MSLFLAEDLMLPLLPPIHTTTKKERNSRFSPLSTQSRVEVQSTRANTNVAQTERSSNKHLSVRATAN